MAAANPPDPDPDLGGSSRTINVNINDRTVPEWMDSANVYGQRIILQLSTANEGTSLPKNPFIIGKAIERTCGKIESANTEEKGSKYVIKTRSIEQAKKLLQMRELDDGTKVKVVLHPLLNRCRCVVSCREVVDMTEEELVKELSDQGIFAVRRITRREGSGKVNTPTLVLSIHGTVVPRHIKFGPLRIPTRLFYPSPMICFKCCSYGHTKERCHNAEICRNCSENHPLENNTCNKNPFCKNCRGNHSPTSRNCAIYAKEEKIIKIKIETGISFGEARKEYEKLHGSQSYAAVSSAQGRLEQIRKEGEKDIEIRKLKEELAKLRETGNSGKQTMNDEKDKVISMLREEICQLKQIVEQLTNRTQRSLRIEISESDADEYVAEGRKDGKMDEDSTSSEISGKKLRSRSAIKRNQQRSSDEHDNGGSGDDDTSRYDGGSYKKAKPTKAKRGRSRKH